jgi:hypothetical protein
MRRLAPVRCSRPPVHAALVACGLLGLLVAGCGRKVSEADCRKVAEHLGEVWTAEAKKEETDGPGKEKAVDVIRQEGERLSRDWMDECKKDLVGKRVESKELDCLLATKTMAEIQKCADSE